MANAEVTLLVTLDAALERFTERKEQAKAIADDICERQRQDAKRCGPEHDYRHDSQDFREFIRHQLDALPYEIAKATDHEEYDPVVRARFVKIAALAVAAVEVLDRLGERMKADIAPEWVVHEAGHLTSEGLQLCVRCGYVLTDYRNAMVPEEHAGEPLRGWAIGARVGVTGTNPKQSFVTDDEPTCRT